MSGEPSLRVAAGSAPPLEAGGPVRRSAIARGAFGSSARQAGWALTDQATVSATNFITSVILGRLAGPAELGLYSMAFSGLLWILAVQETLVTLPYTVFASRVGEADRGRLAGSALVHHAAIGLVAFTMLALAGLGAALYPHWAMLRGMLLVLALIVPFVLLRDFVRRVLFAHLEHAAAAKLDLVVSACQVGGLALLAGADALTAPHACLVLGAACGVGGCGGLVMRRRQFRPRLPEALPAARASWRFGRWGFGSRVLGNLNSDITMVWVVGGMLGSQSTGVFAACAAIVAFSNPFMLGSAQYLMPKICRDFAKKSQAEWRRMVAWLTLAMGLVMASFCLAIWLVGGWLLERLYGHQYQGHETTLVVLALAVLATALGVGAGNALFAMDRPDLNFKATLLGMIVGLAAVAAMALPFGLTGVAAGLLLGHLVDSAARGAAFLALSRDPVNLAPAAETAMDRPPSEAA